MTYPLIISAIAALALASIVLSNRSSLNRAQTRVRLKVCEDDPAKRALRLLARQRK